MKSLTTSSLFRLFGTFVNIQTKYLAISVPESTGGRTIPHTDLREPAGSPNDTLRLAQSSQTHDQSPDRWRLTGHKRRDAIRQQLVDQVVVVCQASNGVSGARSGRVERGAIRVTEESPEESDGGELGVRRQIKSTPLTLYAFGVDRVVSSPIRDDPCPGEGETVSLGFVRLEKGDVGFVQVIRVASLR